MSGDEPAERLAHEVACELGYATPDGLQASFLSGHDTHTLHYKVNVRYKIGKLKIILPVLTKSMTSSHCKFLIVDYLVIKSSISIE